MRTTDPDRHLEVRCCCQPRKLLGWLPVPIGVQPGPGVEVMFTVEQPRVELEGLRFDERVRVRHIPGRRVTLPMAEWREGSEPRRLAFKSEETPVEDLRRIPGFSEHDVKNSGVITPMRRDLRLATHLATSTRSAHP